MKPRPLKPPVPREADTTARHAVIDLLHDETLSAKDLSYHVRISEKEVYDHLEHIRRTVETTGGSLEIVPAECRSCGFVFKKRGRLAPPGKCPVCRHEAISEPLFRIREP